jgi:hypothetical protein
MGMANPVIYSSRYLQTRVNLNQLGSSHLAVKCLSTTAASTTSKLMALFETVAAADAGTMLVDWDGS